MGEFADLQNQCWNETEILQLVEKVNWLFSVFQKRGIDVASLGKSAAFVYLLFFSPYVDSWHREMFPLPRKYPDLDDFSNFGLSE